MGAFEVIVVVVNVVALWLLRNGQRKHQAHVNESLERMRGDYEDRRNGEAGEHGE